MTNTKLNCALVVVTVLLAACDQGSGTAGIDGSGAPITQPPTTHAYGMTTALGVQVNGVRYDTSNASIEIDGVGGRETDIRIGDVLRVEAAPDPRNFALLRAVNITVDDVVEGPITAIDVGTSTLVVLGQTVRVAPTTVFDETMPDPSLSGLVVGAVFEVAGFRASNGDVIATRIEPKATGFPFETTGVVSNLDAAASRFTIGALTVDTSSLDDLHPPAGLRDGEIVEVRGTEFLADGALVARSVSRSPVVEGKTGERVDMEGYVTAFDAARPQTFDVAGVSTHTTTSTVLENVALGLDAKVTVKGSLDAAGAVIARNVGGGAPEQPPDGYYVVVGRVFDAITGGIPYAPINLWIQTPTRGWSYWWGAGRSLETNGVGEFTTLYLPKSQIMVHAGFHGLVQPCAVIVDVPGAPALQVEVMPASEFDSLNPRRPQFVSGNTLTGTIFETVDGVRQPVPGAAVWAYNENDVDLASTKSDLQGRYFLCNLPPVVALTVAKDGYQIEVVPAVGERDVELKRR